MSQAEGELKRKYRYVREEKIFKPMKRFRSRKRSELNEVEKREKKLFLWGRGDGGRFDGKRGVGVSVDVKLFTQMEEEAGRFTGETAHRGKDKVGSNQEVGDVSGVDLASDGSMVAGWAGVLENGSSIGGEPDETKDNSVQRGIGCAVVVQ